MVRLEKLLFRFNSTFRIEIEELVVKEGEILGIIGPNGSGKTTLLNIIALHEHPESGVIELFRENASGRRERLNLRRRMSYVFSRPYLLKGTVYDNVILPLRLRGYRDPGRVREMLELFDIESLKNTHSSQLSQGQRHRVALARAFSTCPELVLLDEPFISLEEQFKEDIIRLLRKAIAATKTTAVFTAHDRNEVVALADKIAVMKEGKILQTGRPAEVFTRPNSKETAVFVGVRTILDGRIVEKAGALCSVAVGAKSIVADSALEKGDEVFVCVRPEDVTVSENRALREVRNSFEGVITGVEPFGLAYMLNLDCGFPLAAFVSRQSAEDMELSDGRQIRASFKSAATHLIKRDLTRGAL